MATPRYRAQEGCKGNALALEKVENGVSMEPSLRKLAVRLPQMQGMAVALLKLTLLAAVCRYR